MDRTELIAEQYLISLGYDPIFEPLGHATCPDFQINPDTAVEVRRLNENSFLNKKPEGLRVRGRSVTNLIETTFKLFRQRDPEKNYWVALRFKRPLESLKIIKTELHKKLNQIIESNSFHQGKLLITQSVEIELIPKENLEEQIFHLGVISDRDSGGWVIPILLENLNFCINHKLRKIRNCSHKYNNWWLILIDEICYGLDDKDKEYIKSKIVVDPMLDSVVILDTFKGKEILKI